MVEAEGLRPGETWELANVELEKSETLQDYDKAWIESAQPGLAWLWPGPDYSPAIPVPQGCR